MGVSSLKSPAGGAKHESKLKTRGQGHYYLLGKGGYVFGSISLFVCLSVGGQHYSTSYESIGMKFYGGVMGSTVKN